MSGQKVMIIKEDDLKKVVTQLGTMPHDHVNNLIGFFNSQPLVDDPRPEPEPVKKAPTKPKK